MVKLDGLGAGLSLVLFVLLLWGAYRYGKNGKIF
jgi:hypothetical protein